MIHDHLLRVVQNAPASSGLRRGESFASYASVLERIDRLAAGLIERGVERGSVVALLMPNTPEIFITAHAVFAIGAIAMPLGLTATRAELSALATTTGLRAVIAAPAFHGMAEALIADVAPGALLLSADRLAEIERAPVSLPAIAPTDAALYLFSSGSTGLPKVVPHTHGELVADGIRTSAAWDLQPDDVAVNILPPNFAMGFLLGVIDVVSRGASTVYWNDPLPLALSRRKLLEAMVGHGVTFMGAVPAMYEIIAAQAGDFDLRLRLAFSGGAALKRPVFDAVRDRLGITLRQAYGSTEAIFVSYNDSADPEASWASVGRPAGDAVVRIAPIETELGPHVGELEIRSSSVMQGYLGDTGANAGAFDDGWFRSGDLALLDDAGRIVIKGRSKLLIEVSGYKVDPIEVEETLTDLPAIAEAAVAGRPDPRNGNRLVAFVVRDAEITADDIIRHARARLSVQKVPVEIAFVDALPRSPTGKLLRARLKDL
jgi:long-chain acyl-CoA synthetase